MSFVCQYCDRSFIKETTLSVHVCEQKRRQQERNEVGVHLGFQAYLKFYDYTQGSSRLKSWEEFAKSPYYRAFVKFGRYCVGLRAVNPVRFMDWLLKNNKKIDYWCKDAFYTEYLIGYLRVEAVDDALTRAIEYGITWQESTGNPAHDCLRYGNTNAICYAVTTGKISPWVIYNSESGQKFLTSLDQSQIAMIWSYIDSDVWQKRFNDYGADQAYAQEILKQAGW